MKRHSHWACILTILPMAFATASAQDVPSADINPPVLRVNDDVVYAAEVSMVMGNIAGQLEAQRREAPEQQQLVQMATQRVVEQKLLAQEARRQGYKPNDLRVAEMVKEVEQQAGGRESLEKTLASKGMSYDQLLVSIKEMDLVRTLIEKQVTPTIKVTDDEVAAFYADNTEMFATPEQVRARHIMFAAGQNADADTIINARASADSARERALAGEDFAELARELSQGPRAAEGGDLGFFSYQQMMPSFAEAAFALEPGEISAVVRTDIGFHVIKVEEKKPAAKPSLEESGDQVRLLLTQRKTGERVQEWIRSLADTAEIVPLLAPEVPTNAPAAQPPSQ